MLFADMDPDKLAEFIIQVRPTVSAVVSCLCVLVAIWLLRYKEYLFALLSLVFAACFGYFACALLPSSVFEMVAAWREEHMLQKPEDIIAYLPPPMLLPILFTSLVFLGLMFKAYVIAVSRIACEEGLQSEQPVKAESRKSALLLTRSATSGGSRLPRRSTI